MCFWETCASRLTKFVASPVRRRHLMQNLDANAVDVSVAIVFCLGLTIPQSTGIGGGFFMVIHNQCALLR